jgi:hypothetical protein
MTTEWSHKVDVGSLPDAPYSRTIAADEQQRRDLARRLGVKAVEDVTADFTIERTANTRKYRVSGQVKAKVTQPCVVTAEDTVQVIDEPFEAWFADKDAAISLARVRHDKMSQYVDAEVPMLEEAEDPEPLAGNQIDVGEVAAQFLSLAVDPYPRAPGVSAETTDRMLEEGGVSEQSRNPFAALKKWKAVRNSDK